jgi:hypothetical protein
MMINVFFSLWIEKEMGRDKIFAIRDGGQK